MKKIMFSDRYGLTDAVLQGRKTMTRRMVKDGTPLGNWGETEKYAYYKIGEVVAVAQSYKDLKLSYIPHIDEPDFKTCTKHAPQWGNPRGMKGWNNKMFVRADLMPHQIRITDIKAERLQDISDEDCLKEGIFIDGNRKEIDKNIYAYDVHGKHTCRWWFPSAKLAFSTLIERPGIGHKGDWNKNPWVIVYTFKLIK